jgi:hypothetical protein
VSKWQSKILGNGIGNYSYNITLNVVVFSSGDLFQVRDAFMKLLKASEQVKNCEPEVDLSRADHMNAPFHIMVPEHLVPVVEWLRRKEFRGV